MLELLQIDSPAPRTGQISAALSSFASIWRLGSCINALIVTNIRNQEPSRTEHEQTTLLDHLHQALHGSVMSPIRVAESL